MSGLRIDRVGAIALLTLDRPDAANAIDVPLARALMEAAIAVADDDSVRCVVLTGAGKMFCAGGDLAAFAGADHRLSALVLEITSYLHAAVARLARMDKPLVTAINGPAAGAGVGLALLGDIVLVAPTAHFTMAYSAVGLSPDAGTSWLLPRLVGLRRAQELCLCNTRVGAQDAATMGMVTRVVSDGQLADDMMATARDLATSATSALGTTRRLLLDSLVTPLETHLDAEARGISRHARSPEGREGISAFIARRKPDFEGCT